MTKVRFGILGTGRIAQDFTNVLKTVENAEVVAVGSRTLESSKGFATQFNIPRYYASYEELAKDKEVDVVYISTIHPHHYSNAKNCILEGKSILCEKPLTMNFKEAEELISLARQHKVFFMEALWSRFFPVYEKIRELISQDTLGPIQNIVADFGFHDADSTPRLQDIQLGGGSLLDVGIYPISLISMIFCCGPNKIRAPEQIKAVGSIHQVDQSTTAILKYGPTELATFISSISSEHGAHFKFSGPKGHIRVNHPFWCPDHFILHLKGKEPETFTFPLPKIDAKFNFKNSEGMFYEAQEVVRCIQMGLKESPLMTCEESLIIMKTLDRIREEIGLKYPHD